MNMHPSRSAALLWTALSLSWTLAGCGGTGAASAEHSGNTLPAALVEAAGVQHGVYAELLALFSDEGRQPLFRGTDLGTRDRKKALDNYRRLIAELTQ